MTARPWISEESLDVLRKTADRRQKLRYRYRYYHNDTIHFFNQRIPEDSRVLWIGLDARTRSEGLRCASLLTLELDPAIAPEASTERASSINSLSDLKTLEPVDYVLLPYALQFFDDIQGFLEELQPHLASKTRIIILQFNFFWAPVIRLAQTVGLKTPLPNLNWLNLQDLSNLLLVSDYQTVTAAARCLMPIGIPGISTLINRYIAPLPIFQWLCQKTFLIARPLKHEMAGALHSVSVVVPARNEAGNIAPLLDRLPVLGSRCEVIFVEGHSKDTTWQSIQDQLREHPRRHEFQLYAFQQSGAGKADAVRLGFSKATGDIFMILDADLSVQPEDLRHFYDALARGSAEFLNGSRLVYQMEKHAMQILNLFFNKVFAGLMSWMIGQSIKDSLCGTKVLYQRDYHRIRSHLDRIARMDPFGDFELLFGAGTLGLRICDVAVRYKQRTYGQTNIRRFRNGWELLRMCCVGWPELKG